MQTKKTGCKQKTKTCHDVNKKDRMQRKKGLQTKKKWNNVERARADTRLAIFRVNEANQAHPPSPSRLQDHNLRFVGRCQ